MAQKNRVVVGGWLVGALFAGSLGAQPAPTREPIREGDRLIYPEGAAIPRSMTPIEAEWVREFGLGGGVPRGSGAPVGPVYCSPEYDPTQAILFSWNGTTSWLTIITQMANRITRFGNAEAWIVVASESARNTATTQLTNGGVDMTKVRFFVRSLNTIWIRDYGPRYIFQGDVRAIVDHVYNRPRPLDDALPVWIGGQIAHRVYALPLIHGGGNFHLDGNDNGFATRLITNENPTLTEPQVLDLWHDYQNLDVHLFDPFPTSVDATQHIDMWMQVMADDKVMISDWPLASGSLQDQICDAAASYMALRGFQVFRPPAVAVSGTHYTYTNVVMCNDLVLIPSYTNSTVSPYNATALATWQAAMPGKRIEQINCQSLVTSAGVMHCIVMHIPRARGNGNPTAYLVAPQAPGRLLPGDSLPIEWISDDDRSVTSVDLLLSTDGGQTFPLTIAAGRPALGTFSWAVPNLPYAGNAKIRVLARDASGNTGWFDSPSFAVGRCPADVDGDGSVDFFDFDAFVGCFEGGTCPPGVSADFNGDGFADFFDFDAFVQAFDSGC